MTRRFVNGMFALFFLASLLLAALVPVGSGVEAAPIAPFSRLEGDGGLGLAAPVAPQATYADLLFSEYVEGSGLNKALEIFNGTGAPVDLSQYTVEVYANGSATPTSSATLAGTLADGDVYVIAHSGIDGSVDPVVDLYSDDATNFNGNDAVVLKKGTAVVDSLGQVGDSSYWGSDTTLRRKTSVTEGDTVPDDAFDPTVAWDSYPQDSLDDLGYYTPAAADASFSITKEAPDSVEVGTTYAYTLTVTNNTNADRTDVVITDVIPLSVTFVTASDGGTVVNGVVSWTLTSMISGATVTRYFTVTAPTTSGLTIVNDSYGVNASDWVTTATGSAVSTQIVPAVGEVTPIGTARGLSAGITVTVAGRATMYTGGFYAGSGNSKFYIQDATGGVAVQCFGFDPGVTIGDWVTVTGVMATYRGEVQVQPADNDAVQVVDGTPDEAPAPLDKALNEVDDDDDALGWLVRIQGPVTDFYESTYYYKFWVSDGTYTATVYVDKNTHIILTDEMLDKSYSVTGIAELYNTTYEIKPRQQSDIVLLPGLFVDKTAPAGVFSDHAFTYTLSVWNHTGVTLTDLVISDTLPSANATLAEVLDGGIAAGGIVSWTVPTVSPEETVNVRFVMTATGSPGDEIINESYAAWATEWITHESGVSVTTVIRSGCPTSYTPTYAIQGTGMRSSMLGNTVTSCGVVVGFFEGNSTSVGNFNGLFIQDVNGDGNPLSSDALFVHYGSGTVSAQIGDLVVVTGTVAEFSEWDGTGCAEDSCMTTIMANASDVVALGAEGTPPATTLFPPMDPTAAMTYWESLEGMLVAMPLTATATVVGPTSYNTVQVVPTTINPQDDGHVLRTSPYAGMPVGVRHYKLYGKLDDGSYPPNLIVGSTITNADGPLAYTYGSYVIMTQAGDPWQEVYSRPAPTTVPSWDSAADNEITIGAFNTLNFDVTTDPKMTKVVTTILKMGCPLFLSLEEIDMDSALPELKTRLQAEGCTYESANSHEDVGGHGVAVLWRTDRVSNVTWSTAYQSCSAYGSPTSTYDEMWAECQAQGEYPLFSRRPVVVTGTVSYNGLEVPIVVIGNHFKSKHGGSAADQRRLEQGQFVNELVASISATTPRVVVMGDLNDFEDSPPLEALYADGVLTSTWYTLAADERYSYIYHGVSQVLDHILLSSQARAMLQDFSPLHFNADFPYYPYTNNGSVVWRASDHDPVVATLSIGEIYKVYLPMVMRNH